MHNKRKEKNNHKNKKINQLASFRLKRTIDIINAFADKLVYFMSFFGHRHLKKNPELDGKKERWRD